MNGFASTSCGLFKAYRHGSDWQVLGPNYERWHSVWASDVLGSLIRALENVPGGSRQIEVCRLSQVEG